MAVLPILTSENPKLREKAKKVKVIDASIQRLIDDMIETMHDANGVGLAAPQVGHSIRLVVMELPEEDQVRVLINPEIIKRSGVREIAEGCLSVPGYVGQVKRAEKVVAKARDRHGKEIRLKAEGLLAQAIEHELDHLDGVLYIDLIENIDLLRRLDELEALEAEPAEVVIRS